MLRYLLIGYIVAYVIMAIAMFVLYRLAVPAEDKKNDEPWHMPLDIALFAAGLAGMLFLYLDVQAHWLEIAWCPVSLALVVIQVWGNLKDRLEYYRSSESTGDRNARAFSDIVTLLLLAPSLALNLIYAFRCMRIK
jgi:uncharacterized membrane-anchored protein